MKPRTEKSDKTYRAEHPHEWGRVDKSNIMDIQKSHELQLQQILDEKVELKYEMQ